MFCTNRMGSRGAEEQEVLVQDVELDLTGTANTNRVRARRDPVGSGINEIPALPWCCFSVAAVRKQCWGGRKKEGSWELGVRMHGQLSLLLKSVLRSISSKWRTVLVNHGPQELGFALYMDFLLLFSKVSETVRVFLSLSHEGMG